MIWCLQQTFPSSVRVSDPQGGCVVWIDLGKNYDSVKLFQLALEHGISITPGYIFSATNKYRNCIRLSYGLPWGDRLEQAISKLGELLPLAKK